MGSCVSGVPRLITVPFRRFCSSKCSNSDVRHPTVGRILRLTERGGIRYVMMGSFSHFTEGCVRVKACLRRVFPFLKMQFVSVSSQCSSGSCGKGDSSVRMRFGKLVTSFCIGSRSMGMGSTIDAEQTRNRCYYNSTPCKCQVGPRGGGRLIVMRSRTRMVHEMFRLAGRQCSGVRVYQLFGRRKVLAPLRSVDEQRGSSDGGTTSEKLR